jgi:hypothetical protein
MASTRWAISALPTPSRFKPKAFLSVCVDDIGSFQFVTRFVMAGSMNCVLNPDIQSESIPFWRACTVELFECIPDEFYVQGDSDPWSAVVRKFGVHGALPLFYCMINLWDLKLRLSAWIPGMESVDAVLSL